MEEKNKKNRKKGEESEIEKTFREAATKGSKPDRQNENGGKWKVAQECTCDPSSCRC